MQKLHACFWLDGNIEEAASYYVKVFKGTLAHLQRAPEGVPNMAAGAALVAHIDILGQRVMLLAGGPFKPNESFSFVVNTDDQAETDYYWNTLTGDGGEESQCGWLKDKYGQSWQITPVRLGELIGGSDKAGAGRAMQAMLTMRNINIAEIEKAYAGR